MKVKTSSLFLLQFGRGGQQRDVKRELTRPMQWARKSVLYRNILKGFELGKVVFFEAEEKEVSLIMMQDDNSFSWDGQGCVFEEYLGQGCLQR